MATIPNTLKQLISLDSEGCNSKPIVLVNRRSCGLLQNEAMNGLSPWVDDSGFTVDQNNPLRISADTGTECTIYQEVTLEASVTYKVRYSYTRNNSPWSNQDQIQLTTWGAGTITLSEGTGVTEVVGEQTFTTVANGTGNFVFRFRGGASTDVTINYIRLCVDGEEEDNNEFCFQLPLQESGSNLLSSTLSVDAPATAPHSGNISVSPARSGSCPTFDYDTFDSIHVGTTAGQNGKYFFKYEIGTWLPTTSYDDNGNEDSALLSYQVDAEVIEHAFDATNLIGSFYTDPLTFTSGNAFDVKVLAYYGDDGAGNCELEYYIESLDTELYKCFIEETFTATNNELYNLKFRLANVTGVTVKIIDSASTVIYQSDANDLYFDAIFNVGVLPVDKTVTVRIDFETFEDTDSASFYTDVLTNVSLYQMTDHLVYATEEDETFIETLSETHSTTSADVGDTYNKNVNYCVDLEGYDSGCYKFRVFYGSSAAFDVFSQAWQVSESAKDYVRVSWQHGNIKKIGADRLDNVSYDTEYFFWTWAQLQDLTQEEERVLYADGAYYLQNPVTRYRNVKTLQTGPLPGYVREAFAVGIMDTFYIDGEAYRKVNDEDISPQFTATGDSPVRILVSKVGDHVVSLNV